MLSVAHSTAGRLLPARVQTVLNNLERMFPGAIHITSLDATEIVFYVQHITDSHLIQTMIAQNQQIFGTAVAVSGKGCVLGPPDFQILCELNPTANSIRGLSLIYLPNVTNRSDYTAGYWYI